MLIKCKDCIYFTPERSTREEILVPKGRYIGVGFFRRWKSEVGLIPKVHLTRHSAKCRRYPKTLNVTGHHSCGEGMTY